MGIGKRGNQVNVIDFGLGHLAKKFRDPKMHLHIPYRENKNLAGTACSTSVNTHLDVEQACHDDLESCLCAHGAHVLPSWCPLVAGTQGRHKGTKVQSHHGEDDHTYRPPLPWVPQQVWYFPVRFDDNPDYSCLCKLFRDLSVRQSGCVFDWSVQ
jgi:hypothetical protein